VDFDNTELVGHEQKNSRPCLIMSRNQLNVAGTHVVGVPLTTQMHKANSYLIALPSKEFKADGAYKKPIPDMVALPDQIRVLDPTRFSQKLGRLSATGIAAVEAAIEYVLDL
jgi:mRNA-degrading endonuclease toxin of MazEF toxin-antitoxin module